VTDRLARALIVHSQLPVPASEVEPWFARPGAGDRLAPPWDPPAAIRVVSREVSAAGPGALLREQVEQEPILLGKLLGNPTQRLIRQLAYRHRQLRRDLARHARAAAAGGGQLTIAVTGASGFVGQALCAFLTSGGHRVRRMVRIRPGRVMRPGDVRWDPETGEIDVAALAGTDAAIHLAGENIGAGRWTAERKRRIRESRVKGTTLLATTLAGLTPLPRVLISASAFGIYGTKPTGAVDETAPTGDDFLAEVADAWEKSTAPAADAGIRVGLSRFANILDPRGGALAKMLPIYKAGLGGRLGSGEQPFPWVALDDVVGAIHQGLFDRTLVGPFNVVAPESVTNAKFNEALARTLGRPAVAPVPAFALKVAFGELAAALLGGPRVLPARLEQAGFAFGHPTLGHALEEMLGRFPLPAIATDETTGRIEVAV
jgi:uncharacterized protein (TIGR01777 family)